MPTLTPLARVAVNSQCDIFAVGGNGEGNGQALQTKDTMSCSSNISSYISGGNDAKNSFQCHMIIVPPHCPDGPPSLEYSHGRIGVSASAERSTKVFSQSPSSLELVDIYRMVLRAELALTIAALDPPAQDGRKASISRCDMAAIVKEDTTK